MFSVPVALVEVFSLKFYIPRFNISFTLSQAAGGRLSGISTGRSMQEGELPSQLCLSEQVSSHEGPKEAQSYLGGKGAGREGKYCP